MIDRNVNVTEAKDVYYIQFSSPVYIVEKDILEKQENNLYNMGIDYSCKLNGRDCLYDYHPVTGAFKRRLAKLEEEK